MTDVLKDLKRFFEILDSEEESDSGTVFHPTRISSCRVMHTEELGPIMRRLREATMEENEQQNTS